jgi:hypothetical protein
LAHLNEPVGIQAGSRGITHARPRGLGRRTGRRTRLGQLGAVAASDGTSVLANSAATYERNGSSKDVRFSDQKRAQPGFV